MKAGDTVYIQSGFLRPMPVTGRVSLAKPVWKPMRLQSRRIDGVWFLSTLDDRLHAMPYRRDHFLTEEEYASLLLAE